MRAVWAVLLVGAAVGVAGCGPGEEGGLVIGDLVPATTPAVATVTARTTPSPTATSTATTPARTAASPSAAASESLYGYVTKAGSGQVTVDVVEWYTGAAVKTACAEDGHTATGAWCTSYYIRNRNKALRTWPVAAGATITVITYDDAARVSRTPGTLADIVPGYTDVSMFRVHVEGGRVTLLDGTEMG